MADRTAAAIFGSVFELLAEQPDNRSRVMAKKLMKLTRMYDFNPYQMECDDALDKLGIKVGK